MRREQAPNRCQRRCEPAWANLRSVALALGALACAGAEPNPSPTDDRSEPEVNAGDIPALLPGGLAKTALAQQAVMLEFLESQPAQPTKGYNVFRVRLSDMAGEPYRPASVSSVPWMPNHGHGTAVAPAVSYDPVTGDWVIDNLNLFMGSYWRIYVFVCDEVEERCCAAPSASCSQTSPSLRDALFLETWIYD